MVNDNPTVKTFNLVDRPWIPVAGENELRSLTAVFSEPAPQRLAGNAVDKIVMFRFLLSIVHASSDIPDEAAWHALTPQKIAENARNYLNVHKDCFDLYDPVRPFLQFPQLKEKADFCAKQQKKGKQQEKNGKQEKKRRMDIAGELFRKPVDPLQLADPPRTGR